MTDEVWHAMLKEWYWIAIVLALAALAFCPSFLRSKCPGCKKRGLTSVPLQDAVATQLATQNLEQHTFFFRCDKCHGRFKRVRTGPFEDATDARFDLVYVEVGT